MKTFMSTHTENIQKRKTPADLQGRKKSNIRIFLSLGVLLLVWQVLSMVYSPLVLPGPALTFETLIEIAQSGQLWPEVAITLQRLVLALLISIITGTIFGILMGSNKKLKDFFEPLVYIVQAVPPIFVYDGRHDMVWAEWKSHDFYRNYWERSGYGRNDKGRI